MDSKGSSQVGMDSSRTLRPGAWQDWQQTTIMGSIQTVDIMGSIHAVDIMGSNQAVDIMGSIQAVDIMGSIQAVDIIGQWLDIMGSTCTMVSTFVMDR